MCVGYSTRPGDAPTSHRYHDGPTTIVPLDKLTHTRDPPDDASELSNDGHTRQDDDAPLRLGQTQPGGGRQLERTADSPMMSAVHGALRRAGLDIVRYPGRGTILGRRIALLKAHRIGLVLDVGANAGQYGEELRRIGYRGRIVSFEPLDGPFGRLEQRTSADPAWTAYHLALGDADQTTVIHVAGNSVSSSLLGMLPAHVRSAPESQFVADQAIAVRRLDSLAEELRLDDTPALMKVDAQGYERQVLVGATEVLPRVTGLQLELALEPLYEGGPLWREMVDMAEGHGYRLMGLEPGFTDWQTGRLLQVDGLFFRPEATYPVDNLAARRRR